MRTRTLALVLIALGLTGLGVSAPACVWTTGADVSDLSTKTCTFQGMDTTCGQCIASFCQDEVDAVCKDAIEHDAGTSLLAALDNCGSGSDTSQCGEVASTSTGDSQSIALATCVNAQCTVACNLTANPVPTSCFEDDLDSSECGQCLLKTCEMPFASCCSNKPTAACTGIVSVLGLFIEECLPMPMDGCSSISTAGEGMTQLDMDLNACISAATSTTPDGGVAPCEAQCTGKCAMMGDACTTNPDDCCGALTCMDGTCANTSCGQSGADCVDDSDCCDGTCDGTCI